MRLGGVREGFQQSFDHGRILVMNIRLDDDDEGLLHGREKMINQGCASSISSAASTLYSDITA